MDDLWSLIVTLALLALVIVFYRAWVHNELPPAIMQLISYVFHASPKGGR